MENLVFDKRMCKVSAKQRMKYCTTNNDEIKFADIVKNDAKNDSNMHVTKTVPK